MNQRLEASTVKITANNQGFQVRGDVKIGGLPATLDYRKPRGDTDAEVRIQALLDDAARAARHRFWPSMQRPVPFKLAGRVAAKTATAASGRGGSEGQKINDCCPAGASRRASATSVDLHAFDKPQVTRFDDIVIDGPARWSRARSSSTEQWRHRARRIFRLRTFRRRQGDAARRPRARRHAARSTMRGELFDGRGFIKSATSAQSPDEGQADRARLRSRRQARHGHRLQCRGAARRRTASCRGATAPCAISA